MKHAIDCDGFAFLHRATVQRVGEHMVQAACRIEGCAWRGSLFGHGARTEAEREARAHGQEGPCAGQCLA